jgi:hypothetical protein
MRPSRRTLLILGGSHIAVGLVLPFLSQARQSGLLLNFGLGIVTAAAIYVWCRQEALERGTIPPGRSALWAALFYPIFVPVYFFRTRPTGSAFKLSAKAYGYYFGMLILMFIAAVLASFGRSA